MRILKWPVWFIELFTTAKSFQANPIIGSVTLNRWGLHVARVRAAQAMTRWRWLFMGWLVPANLRREFRENGYVKIENFLAPGEFRLLREEVLGFDGELRRMVQGDTFTFQGLLDEATVERMPACRHLLTNQRFLNIMMYGGAAFKYPMFFAHLIRNGFEADGHDPQKDFHSDTFHPTMKAWLFLDDVDEEIGPFNYVPGSNRLTRERVQWEQENAVAGGGLDDSYARRGSLRISPAELERRGFGEAVAFKVPANTLVMADTFGFHRRGDAAPGSSRLAIYAYSRSNPFNPFPGILPKVRSRIEQHFTKRALAAADRHAERRGARASWHLVANSELRDNAAPPNAQGAAQTSRSAA